MPHYSYREQKKQRYKILKILLVFLIFFIVYNCLAAFFFSVWSIDNDTMQPALAAGDRIIFTSFSHPYLYKRGSIVLVDMARNKDKKLPLRIIDTAVRFLTAQRLSIFSGSGQYYVKRVIGLPGDEISMNNYQFRVKSKGSQYSLTEFELSEKHYHPAVPKVSELWDESIPFSGTMQTIILGPDECFLVSDDRSNSNDSRTWGVISPSLITGRAVLRFWPFSKIDFL